ncbi:MAG: hypothetical protein ACTSPA_04365 [Promethearchaeota archaeon]
MDSKKITTNRGLSLILLILVIISSIVLISSLIANQNFDNERLTSRTYAGSLIIEDQPVIAMEVYFDGFGLINATMDYSNDTLTYEGIYICRNVDVQFSFMTEEFHQFTFLGILQAEDAIITGVVQLRNSDNDLYNGTFYLPLI